MSLRGLSVQACNITQAAELKEKLLMLKVTRSLGLRIFHQDC